jgi:hypothetical protein
MTATKKNTTGKPAPDKADAALCLPCALNPSALDRTFDAISQYPGAISH